MRFKVGMTFRVVLDDVKDATGYPILMGVGFLWHARSGSSFKKGDEFTIRGITGYVLHMQSKSPRVKGEEVMVFKRTLSEALKANLAEEVNVNP